MRAAGRLGAARHTAVQAADGHVSVPFFFFFPPLLPPLSTEQHFPTLLPLLFLLRGRWSRAWGRGGEDAGAGPRWSPAPGRAAAARPPLLASAGRDPRGRGVPISPASPRAPPPALGCGSRVETAEEQGPGRCLAPRPAGPRLTVGCGLIALASGRWRLLLGFFRDGYSDAESLKVPEESAGTEAGLRTGRFLPRLRAGISTRDRGPRSPESDRPAGGCRVPRPAAAPRASPWPRSASPPRPRFRNGNAECGNRRFK